MAYKIKNVKYISKLDLISAMNGTTQIKKIQMYKGEKKNHNIFNMSGKLNVKDIKNIKIIGPVHAVEIIKEEIKETVKISDKDIIAYKPSKDELPYKIITKLSALFVPYDNKILNLPSIDKVLVEIIPNKNKNYFIYVL